MGEHSLHRRHTNPHEYGVNYGISKKTIAKRKKRERLALGKKNEQTRAIVHGERKHSTNRRRPR